MLAKKTSKNQLTLPKAVVQQIPDVEYFDVSVKEGEVILRPVVVSAPEERLKAVRAKVKALGLTEKDIEAAIRWARGRRR
ncbi:MAG: AbrB/MazE/SpoVT family DNA-binding domain-containing protein [candidate division NC10 bacterium]|nr:AbrB/MazE/SpoVT family DNA-binding domain-containing protein [candidate division NC10 bacterium]MBI4841950.1 AbrB/MazE/SpoVT family DNA-binding domain-containing protein [candidate division NC10 bacterium]